MQTLVARIRNFWNVYLFSSVALALYIRMSLWYISVESNMGKMFSDTLQALVLCNVGYLSSYILIKTVLYHITGDLSPEDHRSINANFIRFAGLQGVLVLIVARPGRVTEALFWLHFTKGVSTCSVLATECERIFQRVSQRQGIVRLSEHKGLILLLIVVNGFTAQLQSFYTFKLSRASLRVVWLISSWCVMCKYTTLSVLIKFAIHLLNEDSPSPLRESQVIATSLSFSVLKTLSNFAAFSHIMWRFNWKMNSVSFFIILQTTVCIKELLAMLNEVYLGLKKLALLKKL